ncbi:hypothetical protein [Pseudomonas aegrilactucae]|uniref:Uncharacterized protein n=1 Tax=Pseudomonas aegrilactucae TaxID=2854028 RepID=A0A9Q2XIE5_9PSED|nr:hypothetical protein [Pseudomonas aegrilactucae]MBV6286737.1 hypothetical protein [Pseudomonas aegrilactucae]
MCDTIQFFRISLFVFCGVFMTAAVLYANQYCKKKGVNMNTFSGMFEMWAMVFKFEEKKFSFIMLAATYGGALMVVAIFVLTLWGQGQGCVFPINDRSIR